MIWPDETSYSCLAFEFPGYRFTEDGKVWSCWIRGSKSGRISENWHEVKPRQNSRSQYLYVTLKSPSGKKHLRLNVLILWAFSGVRAIDMEAAHRNGDRLDNRLENLIWKSHADNIADKIGHGTVLKGQAVGNSKLTDSQVVTIRGLAADGVGFSLIAARFCVSESLIRKIAKGQRWTHVGVTS